MEQKSGKEFEQLKKELVPYLPALEQAAEVIHAQGVSVYPIFVVHQHLVDIGINIVDREAVTGDWSVNASTLEEFVAKQVLSPEKIDDFKLVYKNHDGELCLFVLSEAGANFVFLPKTLQNIPQ
ncbi:MAG TPA: hypothetical protein ENJ95_09515 [Bacteroidetes bacterium]|nr:hypothetical protein [Bacteroidota bacterium]